MAQSTAERLRGDPSITDIPGIWVGHWTDLDAATGCTVVLCGAGAQCGVDVRGSAPATRETDLLRPGNLVGKVHAIVLSGGSAFGLDAAGGVMRYLEERGIGYSTAGGPVPIVPGAALFDLGIGRADVRPTAESGYAACVAAIDHVQEGCVGAGTGATVAKLGGPDGAIKSGIGSACLTLQDGTLVAALVAVNALGSIYDPINGDPIALPRTAYTGWRYPFAAPAPTANTTIGVVATTARLDSIGVNQLARVAHDGMAMAIRPTHTQYDGDTLFALSMPPPDAPVGPDPLALGWAAADAVAEAIVRAVRAAKPLHGIPSAAE
jgi:L-aminopeptidase/D-esterase-like protein